MTKDEKIAMLEWSLNRVAVRYAEALKALRNHGHVFVAAFENELIDILAESKTGIVGNNGSVHEAIVAFRSNQRVQADDAAEKICGDCLETLPNHLSNCVHVAHRG